MQDRPIVSRMCPEESRTAVRQERLGATHPFRFSGGKDDGGDQWVNAYTMKLIATR